MPNIFKNNNTISIELDEIEQKILLTDMISIEDWITNMVVNKIRIQSELLVREHTDKQPKRLTFNDKKVIIQSLELETAKERTEKFEAELKNRG